MSLDKKGFTIIELLMAMAFFSMILLLVTYGFIQINRSYTRGITVKTIQESSRLLMDDLTEKMRESAGAAITPDQAAMGGKYRLCIGGVRYGWNQHLDGQTNYTPSSEKTSDNVEFSLVRAEDSQICDQDFHSDSTTELLDSRAAVQYLNIEEIALNTYKIVLVVSTADAADEDLEAYGLNARCEVRVADEYCDVAKFETVVHTRN